MSKNVQGFLGLQIKLVAPVTHDKEEDKNDKKGYK